MIVIKPKYIFINKIIYLEQTPVFELIIQIFGTFELYCVIFALAKKNEISKATTVYLKQ